MKHILTFHNGPLHDFHVVYDDRFLHASERSHVTGYDGEYAARAVVQDFTANKVHTFYTWQGESS